MCAGQAPQEQGPDLKSRAVRIQDVKALSSLIFGFVFLFFLRSRTKGRTNASTVSKLVQSASPAVNRARLATTPREKLDPPIPVTVVIPHVPVSDRTGEGRQLKRASVKRGKPTVPVKDRTDEGRARRGPSRT